MMPVKTDRMEEIKFSTEVRIPVMVAVVWLYSKLSESVVVRRKVGGVARMVYERLFVASEV